MEQLLPAVLRTSARRSLIQFPSLVSNAELGESIEGGDFGVKHACPACSGRSDEYAGIGGGGTRIISSGSLCHGVTILVWLEVG